MKNKSIRLITSFLASFVLLSCTSTSLDKKEETPNPENKPSLASITDLVLIYGGGAHRTATWDAEHFEPYVGYSNKEDQKRWLFDGFLFLEIVNGKGKIFATGYYGTPSTKQEWSELLDYYFTKGESIYALDDCVAKSEATLGKKETKRKVVIGLPEPIAPKDIYDLPNNYWGQIDGKDLDFSKDEDRISASKWFIDRAVDLFNKANFENIELAGFYWIAEETLHTKTILAGVADYLNKKSYSFNWIPYWKEQPDYLNWKDLKFNYTYLQPNYFFNKNTPYSRLTQACEVAKKYDLDLELEFDLRAMADNENWADRLYDYMNAFRNSGLLSTKRIAYYQDADALYQFSKSKNEADQKLYHDFCSFVVEHSDKYNATK